MRRSSQRLDTRESPHPGLSFPEFVIMIAALMALNALAMDIMLPALPQIGDALNILRDNDRQLVLISYLIGFGGAQLVYGPVSDAFGRRTILLAGLGLYTAASVGALFSQTLDQFLFARLMQGVGCAATRVIAVSVVRDCYSGRQMGRVMSLAMMIFMAIPIVAPSIGQVILLVADWVWIFSLLLVAGIMMLVWCALRLPETLPPSRRQPFSPRVVGAAYLTAVTTRLSIGYTLATTFIFGVIFSFISMAQQIYVDIFGLGVWFPVVFAAVAITMSVASFLNARLVGALGLRRLSHSAVLLYMVLGFLQLALGLSGLEDVGLFTASMALLMACFGFIGPNFNAMAMEPLGAIAGTASSVIGFVTTLGGALLGFAVGQVFDGTLVPLGSACALFGTLAVACVLFAENGLLFRAREGAPGTKG
ncbi:multidrug effflux MFS transporter [Polymorphum gilvum]|uniref:Bcr/CflA family efflux transporter n=1 Tax=Polymorphum gilvum (strain LMG 25793 / CGMCC 1.9160 / SL003B-26A1) TaxID=991905 RepID=F2J0G7_POLGS|nr:multidrug effflux MFS transporter [Polymorphum gilvum]ADZ69635.1 Drug resistance transporter, Bcr/CflA family protein [Polymorphum gilvum SL003B-26A1]